LRKLSRRNFVKLAGAGAVAGAMRRGGSAGNTLVEPPCAILTRNVDSMAARDQVPPIPRIVCTHFADHFEPTCLSNGLIGIRPGANPLAQAQTLVSGFVRNHPTMLIESLSPAPYPLGADFKVNGRSLLAGQGSLHTKSQTLDMSTGELSTEMVFSSEGRCSLELKVLQFVSRSLPALLCQEVRLTPSAEATIEILTSINHAGIAGSVYFDRAPFPRQDTDLRVMGFRNDRNKLGIATTVLPNGLPAKADGAYSVHTNGGRTFTFRTIASMVSEVYDPEPEI